MPLPTGIKDPLNRPVEGYSLDIQDRPVTVTNIENLGDPPVAEGTMSITYGLGGFMSGITRFDGSEVAFEYDGGGRLSSVAYPSVTNSFTYLANGLLDTAASEAGTISNTYDGANRLTASVGTAPSGSVTYVYYPGGQVSNVVSVAGTTAYANDAAERVTQITSPDGTFTYGFDSDNGLVSSNGYENGVSAAYGFDVMDRVTNIVWTDSTGTNVLNSFAYSFNAAGMVTNLASADGSKMQYEYNDLDMLTSETKLDATNGVIYQKSCSYDLAGNRTNAVVDGVTNVYTLGTGNKLSTWGTNGTMSYAAAGNVTNITFNDGRSLGLEMAVDDLNYMEQFNCSFHV